MHCKHFKQMHCKHFKQTHPSFNTNLKLNDILNRFHWHIHCQVRIERHKFIRQKRNAASWKRFPFRHAETIIDTHRSDGMNSVEAFSSCNNCTCKNTNTHTRDCEVRESGVKRQPVECGATAGVACLRRGGVTAVGTAGFRGRGGARSGPEERPGARGHAPAPPGLCQTSNETWKPGHTWPQPAAHWLTCVGCGSERALQRQGSPTLTRLESFNQHWLDPPVIRHLSPVVHDDNQALTSDCKAYICPKFGRNCQNKKNASIRISNYVVTMLTFGHILIDVEFQNSPDELLTGYIIDVVAW